MARKNKTVNGVVRGLLCSRCNTAIGLFKDNIDNMKIAIEYIESDGIYEYNRNQG